MCFFVKTAVIITFCLCASPKLFDSLKAPVIINSLQVNEVRELLMACNKFVQLKMRDVTIYTVTNQNGLPKPLSELYLGTAGIKNYDIPVENKSLLDIWVDTTFRQYFTEIALRVINVVESVGVFLIRTISILACYIVYLSETPKELLRTFLIPSMEQIDCIFTKLCIPCKPIDELRTIIQPFTYEVHYSPEDMKTLTENCIYLMEEYKYISGFVDIGDISMDDFDPDKITGNESVRVQLEFIQKKVDIYFNPERFTL